MTVITPFRNLVLCLFNDVFITQMGIRGMKSEDTLIPP